MNEALVILQEECAEVSQIISKIHRFGPDSKPPISNETNLTLLHKELGDLLCMINICLEKKLLDVELLERYAEEKREKLKLWSNL
jgi:NTP pyrophosphatase (non-canonical NTP hydrolase)